MCVKARACVCVIVRLCACARVRARGVHVRAIVRLYARARARAPNWAGASVPRAVLRVRAPPPAPAPGPAPAPAPAPGPSDGGSVPGSDLGWAYRARSAAVAEGRRCPCCCARIARIDSAAVRHAHGSSRLDRADRADRFGPRRWAVETSRRVPRLQRAGGHAQPRPRVGRRLMRLLSSGTWW